MQTQSTLLGRARGILIAVALMLPFGAVAANVTPAAATYHPGVYQWTSMYLLDGSYQGASKNQADFYTWSDGTESVSNLYAGLSRGPYHPGQTMTYQDTWLLNYNGTRALYVTFARIDCGLNCTWSQTIWSGWVTVYAQSQYGLMQHKVYGGANRAYQEPAMAMYWP